MTGSREQQAIRGAKAEEAVGAILNRLPGNHRVLHDVPKQFGNIDHLVFREDGAIFLIESKSHHGEVTVRNDELRRDGRSFERDLVSQTLSGVSVAEEILGKAFWLSAGMDSHCNCFHERACATALRGVQSGCHPSELSGALDGKAGWQRAGCAEALAANRQSRSTFVYGSEGSSEFMESTEFRCRCRWPCRLRVEC
jgi:hypothetical protein